jgi:hypothetical protein
MKKEGEMRKKREKTPGKEGKCKKRGGKPRKGGENPQKKDKTTYRPFLDPLARFPVLGLTLVSSSTLRSSSEFLLCLVLRFLGGSLGSESPRLRVTWAFERLFGRFERGAIMVEKKSGLLGRGLRVWEKAR